MADGPLACRTAGTPVFQTAALQSKPHQIEQELQPKIKHSAPGIFYIAASGLPENAFRDIVCDLIAQIVFNLHLNAIFIHRIDRFRLHAIKAKKLPMALVKLPE